MRRLPPGLTFGRLPHRRSAAGHRLLPVAAAAAVLALVMPASAAFADPSPSTTASPGTGGGSANNVGPATAGTPVCTLQSGTLTAISGLAVTQNAIMVVEAKST